MASEYNDGMEIKEDGSELDSPGSMPRRNQPHTAARTQFPPEAVRFLKAWLLSPQVLRRPRPPPATLTPPPSRRST